MASTARGGNNCKQERGHPRKKDAPMQSPTEERRRQARERVRAARETAAAVMERRREQLRRELDQRMRELAGDDEVPSSA